jgi:signal transduction histidine kinase
MSLSGLIDWFAGDGHYMDLKHCMHGDTFWIAATVVLDLAVALGYGLIAIHWWKNQRLLGNNPAAKAAMGNMRNIFLFCGICGYVFIPIKMYWPAWRLYDMFMVVLVYYTWRYAWNAKDLKVIYHQLSRTAVLTEELEASRAEAKRKTFFLNAVSHDLRNPLYGVSLQAELAEMALASNDTQQLREALARIKQGAKETSGLLNNFLDLGRLDWSEDPNQVVTFDLGEVVSEIAAISGAAAGAKELTLNVRAGEGVSVSTDKTKVQRIVSNLIDNAVKFTPAPGNPGNPGNPGSKEGARPGVITIEVEEGRAGEVAVHVADTGEGIAPDQAEHIFDEFYQVHNQERSRKKGYGLGLAIAQRLAQQLGGTLALSSKLGEGSRFTLRIPRVAPTNRIPGGPGPGSKGGNGNGHGARNSPAAAAGDGAVGRPQRDGNSAEQAAVAAR